MGTCTWTFLVVLIGASLCGSLTAEVSPDNASEAAAPLNEAATRTELHAVWAGSRDEVSTARVQYLSLIFHCQEQSLSLEDFEDRLSGLELVGNPDVVREVLTAYRPDLITLPEEEYQRWVAGIAEEQTYLYRGSQERSLSKRIAHILDHDLHLVIDSPNHTVNAYLPGQCPLLMRGLNWFRIVPLEEMLKPSSTMRQTEAGIEIEDVDPQGGAASLLLVSPDDGLPRRWALRTMPSRTVTCLHLFRDYLTAPGNVLVPGVRVQVNFSQEMVGLVQMTIIQDSQFNLDVPDDDFRLAVDEKWSWFDLRTNHKEGRRFQEPVDDAAAYFRERSRVNLAGVTAPGSVAFFDGWRAGALLLNGLILIGVGAYLWRRSM